MELRLKKIIQSTVIVLLVCLVTGTGLFVYNANHGYHINSGFTSLPLNYNPDDSTSSYRFREMDVTVQGGFIKGIQKNNADESLVIRALSPLPAVTIKNSGAASQSIAINLENINPETYAASIDKGLAPSRITVNTLAFTLNLESGETRQISPTQTNNAEHKPYVVLGDNRDGYDTFDTIITQVNALKPAFVIDNGDLVFSGKPNQYRLFDQMVSGIAATVCTTLGNHDIRGNGREIYTSLYGPPYYAFDLGDCHYIFLDSSRGYSQTPALPDEEYAWLEQDLQKAQGKKIYVISHVPPTDPRSDLKPNEIIAYTDKVKQQGDFIEQKLESYSENETLDHGFLNKQEAQKFENLMARYQVNTVYLSHIHSYFDYTKDGVRYLVSGGAGAELLTQNSYYHYLIVSEGAPDLMTMIQLPSPTNQLQQRYEATFTLFATALYRENQGAVIFLLAGLILLVVLVLLRLFLKWKVQLNLFWGLVKETRNFMVEKYRTMKNQNK
jgi:hypothetical protein